MIKPGLMFSCLVLPPLGSGHLMTESLNQRRSYYVTYRVQGSTLYDHLSLILLQLVREDVFVPKKDFQDVCVFYGDMPMWDSNI